MQQSEHNGARIAALEERGICSHQTLQHRVGEEVCIENAWKLSNCRPLNVKIYSLMVGFSAVRYLCCFVQGVYGSSCIASYCLDGALQLEPSTLQMRDSESSHTSPCGKPSASADFLRPPVRASHSFVCFQKSSEDGLALMQDLVAAHNLLWSECQRFLACIAQAEIWSTVPRQIGVLMHSSLSCSCSGDSHIPSMLRTCRFSNALLADLYQNPSC